MWRGDAAGAGLTLRVQRPRLVGGPLRLPVQPPAVAGREGERRSAGCDHVREVPVEPLGRADELPTGARCAQSAVGVTIVK
jgi:hypothetical protein